MQQLTMTFVLAASWLTSLLTLFQPQTADARGSITGQVVDADTHVSLPGVSVGSRALGWVTTDDTGHYRLTNVPPGLVPVHIQGNFTTFSLTPALHVTVQSGKETADVDFEVRLTASISGRVVDESGVPIANAKVLAVHQEYTSSGTPYSDGEFASGELTRTFDDSATTNQDGFYTLPMVRAGLPHRLLAFVPRIYANPVSTVAENRSSRPTLLAATYYPSASTYDSALPVTLYSGQRAENVDIHMPRMKPFCMRAVLRTDDGPAPMFFAVQEHELAQEYEEHAVFPWMVSGKTGANGVVRVCDLYPGSFRLVASDQRPANPPRGASAMAPVTVVDADVDIGTVQVKPPITITGEAVWERRATAERSAPTINVNTAPPQLFLRERARGCANSVFSVNVMQDKRYSLIVRCLPAGAYVKDIVYNGTSIRQGAFVPSTFKPPIMQFIVGDDGGSITATVQRDSSKPYRPVWILIAPVNARLPADLAGLLVLGRADENGSFTARGLSPDVYRVLATPNLPAYIVQNSGEPVVNKTPEGLAKVAAAMPLGQVVTLGPRGGLAVSLTPRSTE